MFSSLMIMMIAMSAGRAIPPTAPSAAATDKMAPAATPHEADKQNNQHYDHNRSRHDDCNSEPGALVNGNVLRDVCS